jgi:hypothetical protein
MVSAVMISARSDTRCLRAISAAYASYDAIASAWICRSWLPGSAPIGAGAPGCLGFRGCRVTCWAAFGGEIGRWWMALPPPPPPTAAEVPPNGLSSVEALFGEPVPLPCGGGRESMALPTEARGRGFISPGRSSAAADVGPNGDHELAFCVRT